MAESHDPPFDVRALLERNRSWVADNLALDRQFFERRAQGQQPHCLWIGCADSRVPVNQLTGTVAGDIFVHRNVANIVVPEDFNLGSVVQYAVAVLGVQHVIVCGHYGCGGIKAALGHDNMGVISQWLRHVKDVYQTHFEELSVYTDKAAVERRLVELNVIAGIRSLSKMPVVQEAWAHRGGPVIHGWAYDLADGYLRDLGVSTSSVDNIEEIYRYDV